MVACLLVTWLVWGSSFAAISWTLEALPPLLLMATRFMVAGAIATIVGARLTRRSGGPRPTRREWRDASIVGTGFVAIGMGATSWAASHLSSSITALLVATAPVWLVTFQCFGPRRRPLNAVVLAGLLAGIGGMALLVAPGAGEAIDLRAAIVLVAANGVWAATSLFARSATRPSSLVQGVGMQMLAGGTLLAIASAACGEFGAVRWSKLGALATCSWVYLVLAASLGGFLAYGWLLEHASTTIASTFAFVNPLVAVGIGAAALGETIDQRVLTATAAIVAAVVLMMVGEARVAAPVRRDRIGMASAARPVALAGRGGRKLGWSPAPTPSFAARREPRPLRATDGMDALAIDRALERFEA